MKSLTDSTERARGARRRLTKQGVLWLTRRISKHALRGEWQSAQASAVVRDRLLTLAADADAGIEALRASSRDAWQILRGDRGT